MTQYISKQANKLIKKNFNVLPPAPVNYNRQDVVRVRDEDVDVYDRAYLQGLLAEADFDHLTLDDYNGCLIAHFSRPESDDEMKRRIDGSVAAWKKYENDKSEWYANRDEQIKRAEQLELSRRNGFQDPEYIEFLRLRAKFENVQA